MRASFCSHKADLVWSGWQPVFDPFIASMTAQQRQNCYTRKHELNLSHLVLSAKYAYPFYTDLTGVPGRNWQQNLPGLLQVVTEAIDNRYYVILTMTDGGQEDWHYWFDNNGQKMREAAKVFSAVKPWLLVTLLWEVIGPGGDWTPEQTQTAAQLSREAWGNDTQLAIEFGSGYAHIGKGAQDWNEPGLNQMDAFFYEALQPEFAPVPECNDRNLDCTSRLLGPEAKNIPPANQGPYYFAAPRPRGTIAKVMFENCAFAFIRGWIDEAEVQRRQQWAADHGWKLFGNGLP